MTTQQRSNRGAPARPSDQSTDQPYVPPGLTPAEATRYLKSLKDPDPQAVLRGITRPPSNRSSARVPGVDMPLPTWRDWSYADKAKLLERLRSQSENPVVPPFHQWLASVQPDFNWDWQWSRLVQEKLEAMQQGKLRRLAVFLPPRHGKSALVTIRYPIYRLLADPKTRVIVGSYNSTLAEKFSRASLRLARGINLPLNPDRQSVADWETASGGGLRAVGVGGGVTGQGADLLVIDDPVKSREEANSQTYRDRVWDWYTDDLYTRLEPGAGIVLVQTRWHEDDLAGRVLNSDAAAEWEVVNLPALAEENDPLGRSVGEALCPERYDEAALAGIRTTLGSWSFAALYQQRPQPEGGGLFKRDWFQIVGAAPAVGIDCRFWDKAGSFQSGDFSAGVKIRKAADGRYYVVDVVRGQWSARQRNLIMRQTAEMDGTKCLVWVEQEGGSGGKESAELTILNLAGFTIRAEPATGSKEVRAMPFAAQAEAGNVLIVKAPWNHDYLQELTTFPTGSHDDCVDASSGAFNKLALMSTTKAF